MACRTIGAEQIRGPRNWRQAQAMAARYRCEYVDLREGAIDHDLFRSIPVDLMFRYNFVPLRRAERNARYRACRSAQSQPDRRTEPAAQQEAAGQGRHASQIADLLKKTEQSQRVLEEVTEGFTLDVVGDEDEPGRDAFDRQADRRPIAISRRSSSWWIPPSSTRSNGARAIFTSNRATRKWPSSTASTACCITPCRRSRRTGSRTIISRIKVMSELDIAERRVPQDGRFRVRYKSRLIDFRVSIMPTIHGEDAVLRVLDKESMSEKFAKLSLDVVGFRRSRSDQVPPLHQRAVRHGAGHRARPVRARRPRSTRR